MDINDLHPPDDFSHRFFVWYEWLLVSFTEFRIVIPDLTAPSLQANGPLTTENVFDYFTTSMFYDKQSNNQVLRMQTIHTGVPLANEAEELKSGQTRIIQNSTHTSCYADDLPVLSLLLYTLNLPHYSSFTSVNDYPQMKVRLRIFPFTLI